MKVWLPLQISSNYFFVKYKLSLTIPAAISALSKLAYLDLYLDSFSGTLPDTFDRLTLLANLNLSNKHPKLYFRPSLAILLDRLQRI